jgi:hypothetical protein
MNDNVDKKLQDMQKIIEDIEEKSNAERRELRKEMDIKLNTIQKTMEDNEQNNKYSQKQVDIKVTNLQIQMNEQNNKMSDISNSLLSVTSMLELMNRRMQKIDKNTSGNMDISEIESRGEKRRQQPEDDILNDNELNQEQSESMDEDRDETSMNMNIQEDMRVTRSKTTPNNLK